MSYSNIETFNKILFDEDSFLLPAICINLVYDSTDPECLKNATTLINYFKYNNRLQQLFRFAFKNQFSVKGTEIAEHQPDGFFFAFHLAYSYQHMVPFFKEYVEILCSNSHIFKKINFRDLNEIPDDFSADLNGRYMESLTALSDAIIFVNQTLSKIESMIPREYITVSHDIYRYIGELNNKISEQNKLDFFLLGNRLMLLQFFQNKELLEKVFGESFLETKFVPEFKEIILYIMLLNSDSKIFKLIDPDFEFLYKITRPSSEETETIENEEIHEVSSNVIFEMVSLVKNNILPIKKNIPSSIVKELNCCLDFVNCISDDFDIYRKVESHIDEFLGNYYAELYSCIEESTNQAKHLGHIQLQCKEQQIVLEKKQKSNGELMKFVNQLRQSKGLGPVLFNKNDDLILSPLESSKNEDTKQREKKKVRVGLADKDVRKMICEIEKRKKEQEKEILELKKKHEKEIKEMKNKVRGVVKNQFSERKALIKDNIKKKVDEKKQKEFEKEIEREQKKEMKKGKKRRRKSNKSDSSEIFSSIYDITTSEMSKSEY
ncbi:Uncharacterized protein QTN25_007273 [Entamoeba marina]